MPIFGAFVAFLKTIATLTLQYKLRYHTLGVTSLETLETLNHLYLKLTPYERSYYEPVARSCLKLSIHIKPFQPTRMKSCPAESF